LGPTFAMKPLRRTSRMPIPFNGSWETLTATRHRKVALKPRRIPTGILYPSRGLARDIAPTNWGDDACLPPERPQTERTRNGFCKCPELQPPYTTPFGVGRVRVASRGSAVAQPRARIRNPLRDSLERQGFWG